METELSSQVGERQKCKAKLVGSVDMLLQNKFKKLV